MHAFLCVFTLSNISISETSRSIAVKNYLKHYWGEGEAEAVLGFGADRFRALVSMVTHRVIMGKRCLHFYQLFYIRSILHLRETRTYIKSQTISNFANSDHGLLNKLPFSVWKKSQFSYNEEYCVSILLGYFNLILLILAYNEEMH